MWCMQQRDSEKPEEEKKNRDNFPTFEMEIGVPLLLSILFEASKKNNRCSIIIIIIRLDIGLGL